MKILRTILFIYCLAAIITCAVLAALVLLNADQLAEDAKQADARLTAATMKERSMNTELKALEKVQRRERDKYSGPEAVDASVAVQDAQAAHKTATAAKQQAELAYSELKANRDQKRMLVIPLLAMLLLHLAGAFFFIPTRAS